jgi:hypothetical protein
VRAKEEFFRDGRRNSIMYADRKDVVSREKSI